MKKITFTILALIALQTTYAQAWTRAKGSYYAKVGLNTIRSNEIFDYNGDVVAEVTNPETGEKEKVADIFENMIQLYGMYGITDKFTVITSVPFKSVIDYDRNISKNSIADIEIGGAYGLKSEGFRITPALIIGLPTGYYNANTTTITGDGELNFMPRLYVGNGTSKFYYTGFLGYNYRTKNRFHEVDGMAEFGYIIKSKWYLILKMQVKESLNKGEAVFNTTGIYDNGQEFLSPNFSVYYKHKPHLHFNLNIGGAIYSRNAQAAPSINIGVALEK